MNEILDSIVDIDQSTETLIQNTEYFLKSEEEGLKEEFAKLDAQYNQTMKVEAQNQYDQIIKSGNAEVERIINKSRHDLEIIKDEFDKAKNVLIEKAIKIITEVEK